MNLQLLRRAFSTSSPCCHIMHMTRMRVVDNSELGRLAHMNRKPAKVIHVYTPTRVGTIGDKVMVAICGEKVQGYIVGVRKQQSHGVPRFDTNNLILVDEGLSRTNILSVMRQVMRAVVIESYGGSEVMKVKEIDIPSCKEGQVLIRVKATGVNPVDIYIRDNRFGLNKPLPYTPGSDCAGVVEQIGTGVHSLKPGDRVFTFESVSGTYAEYSVCNANSVFQIPGHLSFPKASGVGVPYFTAYRALFQKIRVNENETVLVHGASGAVGIACIQLLRALMPTVKIIGTAGSEEGLELVKECGAVQVYNHREKSYIDSICKDQPAGVDVIVEMLANENLDKDLARLIGQNGRVVIIGARDNVTINPRLLMKKESSVTGVALRTATPAQIKATAEAICSAQVAKFIDPPIDREFSLEQAGTSQDYVMESSGHRGKVVLSVSKE